ncbi:unnamed protein product [Leptosia nina]|uniref:PID domain-containing protein n=1 Tax=Leptosia nina TaxID=320188 RepID=A0AAV1K127_9NEOP
MSKNAKHKIKSDKRGSDSLIRGFLNSNDKSPAAPAISLKQYVECASMFKRGKSRYIRVILKVGSWKRVPMKLFKWSRKMPSTKQYDLVTNDEYDTKISLHPDEAFEYGITFHAKYIGTMDVPRPTSRVEIVAAMRRVRYEFKARGVKKRKVTVDVSTEGVRVKTRTKKTKGKSPSSKLFGRKRTTCEEAIELMHHPIYRIFYVSHDSSDLKIFSYIARDGATNVFKCSVFKSSRKVRRRTQDIIFYS